MVGSPRIAVPIPTSFELEYNRRCWPEYARALESCGATPVEIALDSSPGIVADLMTSCRGVLLPGSPADVNPQKYGHERAATTAPADVARENVDELLLQDAHNLYKPVFGICYGLQMLNTWRGGTLVQDLLPLPVNHSAGRGVSTAHGIAVQENTILGDTLILVDGETSRNGLIRSTVNSSHHQAVGIPGDNLRVSARSVEDGVVEALEGGRSSHGTDEHFVIGVQWHPERSFSGDRSSRALFERFVIEAKAWVPRPILTSVVSRT